MSNGLYTGAELVDRIVVKLDGMMKSLIGGERLGFCAAYVEIMQMLASLKKGIDQDEKAHRQQVKMLEDQLERANHPDDADGGIVGGERFKFGAGPNGEIDPNAPTEYAIPFDAEDLLSGGKADE